MKEEQDYIPDKGMRGNSCNQNILEALARAMGEKPIFEFAIWKTVLTFLDTGKDRKERVMKFIEEEVSKWLKE